MIHLYQYIERNKASIMGIKVYNIYFNKKLNCYIDFIFEIKIYVMVCFKYWKIELNNEILILHLIVLLKLNFRLICTSITQMCSLITTNRLNVTLKYIKFAMNSLRIS